ncbi:DNA-dependent metalloprotease WSS1 homolog 2-like [Salvia splendens]|uniref:DNA-dependent metalloprotease WSS1 homolog 2-like n=1 Tax=Salvia splendens TaxID=180675 RepID=UPI001C27679F|nr:DNA-dependent metalloprotease WSS1 homolog 2-like [Salvia splendens]
MVNDLNPPASKALELLHKLASDPGIVAIMNKHRWRVGILTEMAPEGYVGISPECILGFNKNHGEEISLRLRTDDLKGFRKYEKIKKTLLHELAHMVFSEHDSNFLALDSQLNKEAITLDWTKSRGHTLTGGTPSKQYDEEFDPGSNVVSSHKLGGRVSVLPTARAASAYAAFARLADTSTPLSGSSVAPDPNINDIPNESKPNPDGCDGE